MNTIESYNARIRLLISRGPHNAHIIAKLNRKIRKMMQNG